MARHDRDQELQQGGLWACIPVGTPQGWRPAGDLHSGDMVWTPDGPPQPIGTVRWSWRPAPYAVLVPEAALGNPGAVLLQPDQSVALDLEQAAAFYGDPVALVPAQALVGWRGIAPCSAPPGKTIHLGFARRQLIYAGPGLLLGCDGEPGSDLQPQGPPAPPLTAEQAAHLMACVMAEAIGTRLRQVALAAAKRP